MSPAAPSRSSRPTAPAAYASATSRSASERSSLRSSIRAKAALLLCLFCVPTFGCYLGHVAAGQIRVLSARHPIDELLADPETPPELSERLRVVLATRQFAESLGLDVGDQYTSYVDWPGDRIVTTVVATRPGEVEPAGFWFPIVGHVPYKGYFDRERAAAEAERLRGEGLDVCEVAVPAYSTLGWLDDPVTAPMLLAGDGRLVETLLHELVHATAFVADEAAFNEGVASFIGEEASVRFYATEPAQARARRAEVEDARSLDTAVLDFREEVEALYASTPAGGERDRARAALERAARTAIAALDLPTRDAAALAGALELNDACLALTGTYAGDVSGYAAQLADLDGNIAAFVARFRRAAETDDPRSAMRSGP